MSTDPALCIAGEEQPDLLGTAAYSPEDNKFRFTPFARLSKPDYERAREAGYSWAGKQKLFVAPAWSPEREDLMLEWCGEIGDEDTTLVDRAEVRADRFDGYRERRADDAESAREAVAAIADNIPLGQPILIGHHSEKHARRDAEKIKSGMRKAVNLWRTSQYWERRAAGALAHASYKEVPAVRHRRIKGLEADLRKYQDASEASATNLRLWGRDGLTREQAMAVATHSHISMRFPLATYPREPPISQYEGEKSIWSALDENIITAEQAQQIAVGACERSIARRARWIQHLGFRLAYERAMLDEGGGIAAERFEIVVGGRVLARREWQVVKRVNRVDGRINSVTVFGQGWTLGVEEISDYKPPAEGDVEQVKALTKLPPLVNYPGDGFRHMLKADYDRRAKHSDTCQVRKVAASEKHGAHRVRMAPKEGGQYYDLVGVYLTDEKIKQPPPPSAAIVAPATFQRERVAPCAPSAPRPAVDEGAAFRALEDSLRAGVKVAVVPQLFVTPGSLAVEVVELLEVDGETVLEPEAGLGALALECIRQGATAVHCIDIAPACVQALQAIEGATGQLGDFLLIPVPGTSGRFRKVAMNPPFAKEQDVDHVRHAFEHWLAPGGRLVAIMSLGVVSRSVSRKTLAFQEYIGAEWPKDDRGHVLVATRPDSYLKHFERLPDDAFAASGATVLTCVLVLEKPAARAPAAAPRGKPGQLDLLA